MNQEKLVLPTRPLKKKVIVLGEGGVGKTTLLFRFVLRKFVASTKMTIGSDLLTKQLVLEIPPFRNEITYLLWDLAGEERFRNIIPNYTVGANCVLLMFDLTRPSTLIKLNNWIKSLNIWDDPKVVYFLVGTKKDQVDDANRNITPEMISEFQRSHKMDSYIETSSKSGENVDLLFKLIGTKLIEKLES